MIAYSSRDRKFVEKLYGGLMPVRVSSDKGGIWVDWQACPNAQIWMPDLMDTDDGMRGAVMRCRGCLGIWSGYFIGKFSRIDTH